jgi:hypothetical protein
MKENDKPVQLVYVSGYGRSGSTLLDTVLGNHSRVFGAGELTWLFRRALNGSLCSCGAPVNRCEFWRAVLEQVFAELPQCDCRQAAAVTLNAESLFSPRKNVQRYVALWAATLRAMAHVSGRPIIVDSSKSSRLAHYRATLLRKASPSLKIIHLVRDPRAVMWSAQRGSNYRLEAGEQKRRFGGMARGLLSWMFSNAAVELLHARVANGALLRVRYEDLAFRPRETFTQIAQLLEIEARELLDRLEAGGDFEPGHGVAGNRMRRSGQIVLRFDEEWRTKLPSSARLLARVAWPLMRRYEYK